MGFLKAAGRRLAYEWVGEESGKPVMVFLHEGLGSIRQWREFPAALAAATGCRALLYDRYGYGQSEVLAEPRRTVRYMHDEALIALPELLEALSIDSPVLVGHSDGASIALIYAGAGHEVRAVVAMAPHVFIEDVCVSSIAAVTASFEASDLPRKLGRYHREVRKTFYGWSDVWLDPAFKSWDIRQEYLPKVRCPVLAIQGFEDEYGTMAQLEDIERWVPGRVKPVKLERCGHAPFRDQPQATLQAAERFIGSL